MPGQPMSAEDRVVEQLDAEDESVLNSLARQSGAPPDSMRLSEGDEDETWALEDPNVDHDTLAERLMVEGLSQQEIAQLQVVKLRPDWAPLFANPTQSAVLADQYAKLARFPYRWSLLEDIDDPDEQVKKAEQLNRRYQKRVVGLMQQSVDLSSMRVGYPDEMQEGAGP